MEFESKSLWMLLQAIFKIKSSNPGVNSKPMFIFYHFYSYLRSCLCILKIFNVVTAFMSALECLQDSQMRVTRRSTVYILAITEYPTLGLPQQLEIVYYTGQSKSIYRFQKYGSTNTWSMSEIDRGNCS